MDATIKSQISNSFLEHLLQGDRRKCSVLVQQYLSHNPSIMDMYEEILKDSLYKVGVLWETNKISVATEHLATAIAEGILNEYFAQIISKNRCNKKVVLTCVENEEHQVGIKMVADVFEMHGWESFFLGTGIPTNELIPFIHEVKPDILAISLSIYFNYSNLIKMLNILQSEFPKLKIIIGGQAFSKLSNTSLVGLDNVVLLPDLYMLELFIKSLNKTN